MTVKDLGDLIIWAGAVAGALGAIGTVLYWVAVRPFRRWLREQMAETRNTVDAVHAEVTPNHGSSLKDQVTRTESEVRQLSRRLTDHLINHPGGGS